MILQMNRRDRLFHWGRAKCYFIVTREMAQYFLRDSDFTRNALLAKVTADIECLGVFSRATLELVGDDMVTGVKSESEKSYVICFGFGGGEGARVLPGSHVTSPQVCHRRSC